MSFCSANITAVDACTMDDLRFIAALAYSVAAAVALLPSLFLLGRHCFRMLKRRAEDSASTIAPSEVSEQSEHGSSRSLIKKLRESKDSAAKRRLRVSFVMFQVGWVLLVFGVISTAVTATTGVVLEPVIGAARFLYFAAALSVFLILLSVLPTDSTLIRLLAYLG